MVLRHEELSMTVVTYSGVGVYTFQCIESCNVHDLKMKWYVSVSSGYE